MEETVKIRNKNTGEVREVKKSELPNYGVGKPLTAADRKTQEKEARLQGASTIGKGVEESGLLDIPVLGGLMRAIGTPAAKYGGLVGGAGYEVYRAAKSALGDQNAYVNQETGETVENPFLSQETLGKFHMDEKDGKRFVSREGLTEGAKRIAGGAAYAVPGGGVVGGASVKGLAGAGALSGFGASEEGNELEGALTGAGGGALLGKVVPGVASVVGRGTSKLYGKLPKAIKEGIETTTQKLTNLEQRKMSSLVGYKNIDKAKALDIGPDMMPEDVVKVVEPEMKFVGDKLNTMLSDDAAGATIKEVKDAILKAHQQVAPSTKGTDLVKFTSDIDDFLRQNVLDDAAEQGLNPEQIADFIDGNSPMRLNIINKIKMRLGERFEDDPLYKQAYKNLQELIEDQSGQKELVRAANAEYNSLREMKNTATKQMKRLAGPSRDITDYSVRKQEALGRSLNDPNLLLAAAGSAPLVSLFGPLGGIPGGTYAIYRLMNALLKDPDVARKLLPLLQAPGKVAQTKAGTVAKGSTKAIKKALELTSPRLGELVGD